MVAAPACPIHPNKHMAPHWAPPRSWLNCCAGGSQSRRVASVVAVSPVVRAAVIPYPAAKAYLAQHPLVREGLWGKFQPTNLMRLFGVDRFVPSRQSVPGAAPAGEIRWLRKEAGDCLAVLPAAY